MKLLMLISAARALIVAACICAVMAGAVRACSGQIVSSPDPIADYNPFDPTDTVRSYAVRIENRDTEPCVFWLRFEPPMAAGNWPEGFDFTIRSEAGALLAARTQPPGALQALASGLVDAGHAHDFRYDVTIPAGQMLPPSRHEQTVTLRLTDTDGPEPAETAPPADTSTLTLVASVEDRLGVNIAGAGTAMTVDFGELTAGDQRRVVLQARSNRPFIFKAHSVNGGALAMASPYQNHRIGYAMRMDGGEVQLPGEIGPLGVTSIAGHSFDVDFTIGDVSGKRAGLYSDEIIIEIAPSP